MVQAERLAAVGQTIAALSHHIKNILQGLKSGSEILKMGLKDMEPALLHQGWKNIEKNQGKIYDLVVDMLSYSKEREPNIESTDLNSVASEVVELMAARAKELGVELLARLDEQLPRCPADPEGIHRALLNIVGNALDAVEDAESPRVIVTTAQENGGEGVYFEVRDNGNGIPPEKLNDIFRPFVSSKGDAAPAWAWQSAARFSANTAATFSYAVRPDRAARSSSAYRCAAPSIPKSTIRGPPNRPCRRRNETRGEESDFSPRAILTKK